MSTPPFLAAAIQFEPVMFAKQANIARLLDLVEQAARQGAKLITTPEMATTGYCWYDRQEIAAQVETVPGETSARFSELAQRYQCYIVLGMPEVDAQTQLYYNSALLIGPQGVIGRHRKSHPYISEPKWAAAGDVGHQVFETPLGKIGMLICMDIHFPETARLLALDGADIICHISNWLAERTPAPYWISRAMENGCYLLESNRWGLERGVQFSGGSAIIAPDGTLIDVVDNGDGIAYGEIDIRLSRQRQVLGEPVFTQRRPQDYHALLSDSFLWNPADFFGLYGHHPLPAGKSSRITVCQFAPTDRLEDNLARIVALAREAVSQQHSELVVFPEMALTGYAAPETHAQTLDAPALQSLIRLAMTLRVYLVVGMAEQQEQKYYNTQVLLGPEGMIGHYRQMHLPLAHQAWAIPGEQWRVFDTAVGRIGLLLGHDALFPESARILALLGCDIVACSAALSDGFVSGHAGSRVPQSYPIPVGADPLHWHLFRTRAGENNLYLAFANSVDSAHRHGGYSGVFGPETFTFPRHEQVLWQESGIATLTIDTASPAGSPTPTNAVRRKDLVAMRQVHHYRPMLIDHR
ncbi:MULTISPECIES: nitrilase-related carbon-nitrogen hydrolase [unclassified Brenneria]|uniref:nitrilase-related carbon-nitrogen hydrolase n=1 Tax=unclassified Brenneria TaxID=2634434 RepID=UPI001555698E|nr:MULTISPECIES: nitrilase-related carbon-nitrogen hydrolase [unclassified Brenneria]MBJ7223691.1 amidohydrolase [Brenneria sp. L3-3C-1]MEE3644933.1 nitrilase-related carbon-nitrogen hydrolase [Brenneria sp. L3_3C_1]MEE3652317.1 nitrilase-related carbon-nitrogen hydrolase [Brenneria sp. HEZEL_4_2_4]NPD02274.1 amidohydrolase [Brenneria sp. hezel4-2-4]